MKLLRDEDLVRLVENDPPLVENLELPADRFSKDSPIQPACLDLRVGRIIIPGRDEAARGGAHNPATEHELMPGSTAAVVTKEKLKLPPTIAGIGFPPYRLSSQGILMTSVGHIDPGYEGPLRLTVINMGKESYTLGPKTIIATVLLFEMSSPVKKDWGQRGGQQMPTIAQKTVDRLSEDFLGIDDRSLRVARRVAEETMRKVVQDERYKSFTQMASFFLVPFLILGLGVAGALWLKKPDWQDSLLKAEMHIMQVRTRVDELERRVPTDQVLPAQPTRGGDAEASGRKN